MRFADVGLGKRATRPERELQTDRDTYRPDLREHAIRLLLSPACNLDGVHDSHRAVGRDGYEHTRNDPRSVHHDSQLQMDNRESLPGSPHPHLQAGSMAEGGWCKDYGGRGAIRAKRAGPQQPICVRAACAVNLRLRNRVPGGLEPDTREAS
jgi:hypothetical protein